MVPSQSAEGGGAARAVAQQAEARAWKAAAVTARPLRLAPRRAARILAWQSGAVVVP